MKKYYVDPRTGYLHKKPKQKLTLFGKLLVLWLLLASICAVFALVSCNRRIAHTPTHREIKKAMRYSTWEYKLPCISSSYK